MSYKMYSKSNREMADKPTIKDQFKSISNEINNFGKSQKEIQMGKVLNSCRVEPSYFNENHQSFLQSMTNSGQHTVNSNSQKSLTPNQFKGERDMKFSNRNSNANIFKDNSNTEKLQKIRKTLRQKRNTTTENSKVIEKAGQKIVGMFLKCTRNSIQNDDLNSAVSLQSNQLEKHNIQVELSELPPRTIKNRFYKILRLRPQRCAEECVFKDSIDFKLKKKKTEKQPSYKNGLDLHSKDDNKTLWPTPFDVSKVPKINAHIHSCNLKSKCVRLFVEKPIVRLDRIAKLDIFLKKSRKKIPIKEYCMKNVELAPIMLTEHKDQFKQHVFYNFRNFLGLSKEVFNIGGDRMTYTIDRNLCKDFRNYRKLPECKYLSNDAVNWPDYYMQVEPIKETAEYQRKSVINTSVLNSSCFYDNIMDVTQRDNESTTLASHFLRVQNAKIDESFSMNKRKLDISRYYYSPSKEPTSPIRCTNKSFSPNILSAIHIRRETSYEQQSVLDDNEYINEMFIGNNDDKCSISKIENLKFDSVNTSQLNSNRTSNYFNNINSKTGAKQQQRQSSTVQRQSEPVKNYVLKSSKFMTNANTELEPEDQLKQEPLRQEISQTFSPEFFKCNNYHTKKETANFEKVVKACDMKPPIDKRVNKYQKSTKNKEFPDNHRDPSQDGNCNPWSCINTDNLSYQSSHQSENKTIYKNIPKFNLNLNSKEKMSLVDLTERSVIGELYPKKELLGMHSLDNTGIFKFNDAGDNFSLRLLSDSRTRVSNEELLTNKKPHQKVTFSQKDLQKAKQKYAINYNNIDLDDNMMRAGKEERLIKILNELEEQNLEIENDLTPKYISENKQETCDMDTQIKAEATSDQKEEDNLACSIELLEKINNCKKDIANQMARLTTKKD